MRLRVTEDRWLASVVGSSCTFCIRYLPLSHFFLNLCWFVASGAELQRHRAVVRWVPDSVCTKATAVMQQNQGEGRVWVGAGINVYEATDAGTVGVRGVCGWVPSPVNRTQAQPQGGRSTCSGRRLHNPNLLSGLHQIQQATHGDDTQRGVHNSSLPRPMQLELACEGNGGGGAESGRW